MSHSKVPWKLKSIDSTLIVDSEGQTIAVMHRENPYDAALIAAAPQLLETLKKILDAFCLDTFNDSIVISAYKLVAKAEGK